MYGICNYVSGIHSHNHCIWIALHVLSAIQQNIRCYSFYSYISYWRIFHSDNLFHIFFFFCIHRYIYVCHAPVARTWCTMPRVLKCICWISFLAFLHQFSRFFERQYEPVTITWRGQPNVTVCKVSHFAKINCLSFSSSKKRSILHIIIFTLKYQKLIFAGFWLLWGL